MRTFFRILALLTAVLMSCVPMAYSEEMNTTSSIQQADKTALANYIDLSRINSQIRFFKMAARRVRDLWNYMGKKQNEDTFVGRCFGIAKKINTALPLIMIGLGVIGTILVFLTLFSLKTLGLLAALFLMNISGAVAKLTLLFAPKQEDRKESKRPQTVHYHIHNDKKGDHGHHPYGGYYEHEDWDRNELLDKQLDERLELYNLYDKLKMGPLYSRVSYDRR